MVRDQLIINSILINYIELGLEPTDPNLLLTSNRTSKWLRFICGLAKSTSSITIFVDLPPRPSDAIVMTRMTLPSRKGSHIPIWNKENHLRKYLWEVIWICYLPVGYMFRLGNSNLNLQFATEIRGTSSIQMLS